MSPDNSYSEVPRTGPKRYAVVAFRLDSWDRGKNGFTYMAQTKTIHAEANSTKDGF